MRTAHQKDDTLDCPIQCGRVALSISKVRAMLSNTSQISAGGDVGCPNVASL